MQRPVSQFGRHVATLREAIDGILSKSKEKPVHELRSTLRRVKAELRLLPESAKTTKRIASFVRLSRPIIKAAGKVRDLDVQAGLLENLPRNLQPDIDQLGEELDKKRRRRFSDLRRLVKQDHKRLLEKIEELGSNAPHSGTKARVVTDEPVPVAFTSRELAQETFARAAKTLDTSKPDQLHELRKAARDARYLAESGLKRDDKRSVAAREAARFHQVHQEVGTWHDYLTLAESAGKYLDESSPLIAAIERIRDQHYGAAIRSVETAKRENAAGTVKDIETRNVVAIR